MEPEKRDMEPEKWDLEPIEKGAFFFFFMGPTYETIGELERTGPAESGAVELPE